MLMEEQEIPPPPVICVECVEPVSGTGWTRCLRYLGVVCSDGCAAWHQLFCFDLTDSEQALELLADMKKADLTDATNAITEVEEHECEYVSHWLRPCLRKADGLCGRCAGLFCAEHLPHWDETAGGPLCEACHIASLFEMLRDKQDDNGRNGGGSPLS